MKSNTDDSASTGTMNLPKPEGFIDEDAISDNEAEEVVEDLSEEFSRNSGTSSTVDMPEIEKINLDKEEEETIYEKEVSIEPPEDFPKNPNRSEKKVDEKGRIQENNNNKDKKHKLKEDVDMTSLSSQDSEDFMSEEESDNSTDDNNSSELSVKGSSIITQELDESEDGLKVNGYKPLGQKSMNIIKSTVYAPSKQDGGGMAP